MSNSTHNSRNTQNTRPRLSRSVYRRRRIIALVVLAVLAFLLWVLASFAIGFVQGLFGGNKDSSSSVSTDSTNSTTIAACDPGSILLEAVVGNAKGKVQTSFDTGINPFFGYKITNTGTKDCSFNVGAKDTYFRVTTGSDSIWTSADCDRTALLARVVTLEPNQTLESPMSDWYRVKSSSTGCGADQKPVVAKGASYHLSVEVGGVVSKKTSQFVLK